MILLYYVIKDCNHGTNPMNFRLFRRTETAKYLLSGVIRDRLVVLLFQLSDVK